VVSAPIRQCRLSRLPWGCAAEAAWKPYEDGAAIAPEPVAVGSGSRFILKVIASSDPDDANNVARPGIDHNPYAVSAPVTP